jgi:hypothetical protein
MVFARAVHTCPVPLLQKGKMFVSDKCHTMVCREWLILGKDISFGNLVQKITCTNGLPRIFGRGYSRKSGY